MELMYVNPRKRRTKARRANPAKRRHHHHARKANPHRRRVHHKFAALRRRRRNPASRKGHAIGESIKDALLGGAGSVGVDAIMGQIRGSLPASVQTGYEYSAVKAAITIALGMVAGRFMGPRGQKLAEGALTVQAAMLITSFVPSSMTLGGRSRILGPAGQMRGVITGGSATGPQDYLPGRGMGVFTGRGGRAGVISRTPNQQVSVAPGAAPRGMGVFSTSAQRTRAREGVMFR